MRVFDAMRWIGAAAAQYVTDQARALARAQAPPKGPRPPRRFRLRHGNPPTPAKVAAVQEKRARRRTRDRHKNRVFRTERWGGEKVLVAVNGYTECWLCGNFVLERSTLVDENGEEIACRPCALAWNAALARRPEMRA